MSASVSFLPPIVKSYCNLPPHRVHGRQMKGLPREVHVSHSKHCLPPEQHPNKFCNAVTITFTTASGATFDHPFPHRSLKLGDDFSQDSRHISVKPEFALSAPNVDASAHQSRSIYPHYTRRHLPSSKSPGRPMNHCVLHPFPAATRKVDSFLHILPSSAVGAKRHPITLGKAEYADIHLYLA